MNNLKKIITLLLSLSIVLMLSACSGKIKDSDVIGNWQVQNGIILSSEAKVLEIYKGGTARAYLDSERNRRYEFTWTIDGDIFKLAKAENGGGQFNFAFELVKESGNTYLKSTDHTITLVK